MPQRWIRVLAAAAVVLGLTGAAPPPPAVYDVEIRYRITGLGNERLTQYFAMTRSFAEAGFVRAAAPPPEDTEPEDTRDLPFRGTIPSAKARLLLSERHVLAIRLLPAGTKLPDAQAALVRVHLELASGYGSERQMLLTDQVRSVLNEIGFREGAAYDPRGYTRMVGALPAGQIERVMKDLRTLPAGAALPAPFRSGPPVRVVEVLPEMPLLTPRPSTALPPPELEKLSPLLRQLVADKEKALEPLRFEAILALTPEPHSREWLRPLRAAARDIVAEGRVGPLVTMYGPRGEVAALAARPEIAALRLPRMPRLLFPQVEGKQVQPASLAPNGPVQLRLQGRMPQGERAAVVDGDFRGWEGLRAAYPRARLRFLDLTRERNRDLLMEPFPYPGPGPGQGTRFADVLLRASPAAELTLICIDPAAPYQMELVARAIYGDRLDSLALDRRLEDLTRRREDLDGEQSLLTAERRAVYEDFRFEGVAEQNRKNYRKKQADHDCEEAAYQQAMARYLQLTRDLRDLKGIRLVLTGIVWDDGQPVDGAGSLTRYFDDRAFNGALWFQYAGAASGQAWFGLFRDQDRNEIMEFAPPEARLLPGRWTRELNFLGWRPFDGKQTADLPANALLRVTLQWQESHEPALLRIGEDPYREPLARLRVVLLHQPDPAGAKQPDDDLEIVAESVGRPERLAKTLNAGVYEHAVLFRVPRAGRYAVRITGRAPADTRPPGVPSVPAARRTFELRPRLFVATLAGDGRAVLADYSTDAGTLGTPADGNRVERVGR